MEITVNAVIGILVNGLNGFGLDAVNGEAVGNSGSVIHGHRQISQLVLIGRLLGDVLIVLADLDVEDQLAVGIVGSDVHLTQNRNVAQEGEGVGGGRTTNFLPKAKQLKSVL